MDWSDNMKIVEKIMNTAYLQIGVSENPPFSNNVKYNTAYYGRCVQGTNYPWCCTFLWWLFRNAGMEHIFCDGEKTAYCPYVQSWAKKKGFLKQTGERGDFVLFNFSGGITASHIGIVSKRIDENTYLTIEGNTSTSNETNGGCVMERTRKKNVILGFVSLQKMYQNEEEKIMIEQLQKDVEALKQQVFNLEKQLESMEKEQVYNWTTACPVWSQPYVQKALELGIIKGDTNGQLNLTDTKIWSLVVQLRALKIME